MELFLKAVYTIGILNFSFQDTSEQGRFLREIQLIDNQTFEVFYHKLMFLYLEMPKFNKEESELVSQFDKWMYVLKNLNRLQERPVKLQERVFKKLFEEAEIARLKPKEMQTYQESLKAYRDNKNTMDYAINEAVSEAIDKKTTEFAKKLKQKGVDIEVIIDTTGLTKEQIEKL